MGLPKVQLNDALKGDSPRRSDTYCHDCGKTFISQIDFRLDGNHVIICPYCGHEHCRVVKDGMITNDRWDDANDGKKVLARVWTGSANIRIENTKAADFLRKKWLRIGLQ